VAPDRPSSERNYRAIKAADSDEAKPFQQFFFRVSDDTGIEVTDYFIDFHVLKPDNSVDADLTKLFDNTFNADVYTHSVNTACRVMMIDCGNLESFFKNIVAAKGKVVFDITGCSSSRTWILFKVIVWFFTVQILLKLVQVFYIRIRRLWSK
jgi:hypothetical protein